MSRRTNVDAPSTSPKPPAITALVSSICRRTSFSPVSGAGDYVETDAIDPVTVYGRTMAKGERAVLRSRPAKRRSCGFRCRWGRVSIVMPAPSTGFSRDSVNGRPATLYFDEVRSCTYTDDLNRVFERSWRTIRPVYSTAAARAQ